MEGATSAPNSPGKAWSTLHGLPQSTVSHPTTTTLPWLPMEGHGRCDRAPAQHGRRDPLSSPHHRRPLSIKESRLPSPPSPQMVGEPIATVPTGPESVAEADRLLALAESELSAGRLRATRRHALHAARLYPTSPRAPVVATTANVLLADASSHHAALLLPEPDDPDASPLFASELRRHFKSLVKSLRVGLNAATAAAYPSVAAAAEEALGHATEAYEALTTPTPGTFWTACAGCRLLHEFERKYVGY
ncbi:hypothetical protein Zm00014a_037375 [Zea mays]|jgi:hypothetical protein|uniref:Uncharacterized protein n=2 Tax=Zea mays TaxID=4577 RepID=A0A317Y1U1_MAIZE|nr:hypothetical protein Zm00014a_037375 [Zea mays]